ncbi:hypothetical protein ACHAXH_006642 [Discostella pseudostelligera]
MTMTKRMAAATTATVAVVVASAAVVAIIHGRSGDDEGTTSITGSSSSSSSSGGSSMMRSNKPMQISNNEGKRQYRSRPAIPDENQAEKIRRWNRRLLDELLEQSSSLASASSPASSSLTIGGELHHQSQRQKRRRRRLDGDEIMTMDHHRSKTSDGEEADDEDVAFQQQSRSEIQQMHDKGPPSPSSPAASPSSNGGSGGGSDGYGSDFYYYPMYTFTLTIGTCTNNGNEPDRYHDAPTNFLFDTLEDCCQAWYVDVVGCTVGNAFPSGGADQLLVRDTMTGELLSGETSASSNGAITATSPVSSQGGGDEVTAESGAEDIGMAFNSAPGGGYNGAYTNGSHHKFYPSFDAVLYPDGACINDGNAPVEFMSNPTTFFYDTEHDCCEAWFMDVDACLNGAASTAAAVASAAAHDQAPASENADDENNDEEGDAEEDEDGTLWPTWADDEIKVEEDAMAEVGDEDGSLWPTWADDDTKMKEDVMVSIGDESGSLWPTWSTADIGTDEQNENDMSSNAAEITLSAPDVADTTAQSNSNLSHDESVALYDSFETGDFTKYDWGTPTHKSDEDLPLGSYADSDSRNIDAWEVDRTSMAYDGNYAARVGLLRSPGSQSNLTITLEGLDVSRGGLLTFAIRAMVEMPVDIMYLTVDDKVARTYDKVTVGSSEDGNEWEEDSVMLLPGQHVVTWSYQHFGMPKEGDPEFETYTMDPRRVGNSWVDAIELLPLTGDMVWPDGGEDAQAILRNSRGGDDVAQWSLVTDGHAFLGDHSFIAYTKDITSSSRNYAEISWTVVAGPAGGVLSFAAFGSIFAPLDILEFRVDGVPEVALTVPTSDWEEYFVNIEPGRHSLKWRLLKNAPGLSDDIIDNLDVPEGYQGYAKIDGIKYVENQVYLTSTTSTSSAAEGSSTTTTEIPATSTESSATTASTIAAAEIASETTEATPTTTSIDVTTTTSELPMQESKAEVTTSTSSTAADASSTSTTSTEPVQEQGPTSTGCPDGLKPVDGLPNCCLEEPNYLGDGACDHSAPYNTEECAFDLGDCCYETCNKDSPYGCLTVEGNAEEVGPFGFFCLDPRFSVIDEENCKVENRGWIGDGGCDAEGGYNTEECGWDMGDCCKETCNEEFSFYPCGGHQPFTCMNPHHSGSGEEGAVDTDVTIAATKIPPTTTTVDAEEASTGATIGTAEIETASTTSTKPSEDPEVTTGATGGSEGTISSTSAMEDTSTTTKPSEDAETTSTSTTSLPATTTTTEP